MATQIQFRRDTSANWTSNNPILAEGEMGIELDSISTDSVKYKIGNGVNSWNSLPYQTSSGGSFDCNDLDNCDNFTSLEAQVAALELEINPIIRTSITNPLTFNENISEDVTINVNTTLELGSGDATKDIFSIVSYRIATGATLTFGTSFPSELLADTSFLNSFTENKTNTVAYVWKGGALRRWSNQVTEFGTPTPTTPTITSAIVTDANPDQIQITFNVTPTAGTMAGFTMNGDFADITIGAILTQVANVWTVQLSRSVLNGESGSLVWVSSDIENSGQFLADSSEVVDNQVGAIAANPVFVSAEIGNVADNVLTITTDINSDFTWIGTPEIILTASGGALTITSAVGDTNTLTGGYNLSRSVLSTETLTIEVLAANGIGNTLDFSKKMGSVTAGTSVNNNTADITSGLINYYQAEGNSIDSSGNGNNLTPTDVTFSNDSYAGTQAFSSNGTSTIATIPNNISGDFTVIASIKLSSVTDNPCMFASQSFTPNVFFRVNSSNQLEFQKNGALATSVTTLSLSVYYRVACTFNNTTGLATIYIDGSASGSDTGGEIGNTFTSQLFVPWNASIATFDGLVDEVKIFNREFTSNEILSEFNSYA